jgi:nucleoside-diphosphate-sugar epimerase
VSSPTVLLTGATGFLGSNVARALVDKKFNIIALCRQSSRLSRLSSVADKIKFFRLEETDLQSLFKENSIDAVIHCATDYGRQETLPSTVIEANLVLPLKLLQFGAEREISYFINTDTILDKGVNYYSLSKNQFKDWLKTYSLQMTCINVALEHFYGPGDDESKFVTWLIRSLLNNEKKIPLTQGIQKRDFIYIDDAVEAFMRIIERGSRHEKGFFSYEIASGQAVTIRDFVEEAKKITANTTTSLDFGVLPYRENEVMDSRVDLSAIKNLGWSSRTSLKEGLRLTVAFERSKIKG